MLPIPKVSQTLLANALLIGNVSWDNRRLILYRFVYLLYVYASLIHNFVKCCVVLSLTLNYSTSIVTGNGDIYTISLALSLSLSIFSFSFLFLRHVLEMVSRHESRTDALKTPGDSCIREASPPAISFPQCIPFPLIHAARRLLYPLQGDGQQGDGSGLERKARTPLRQE